jgi:hypothetical protein
LVQALLYLTMDDYAIFVIKFYNWYQHRVFFVPIGKYVQTVIIIGLIRLNTYQFIWSGYKIHLHTIVLNLPSGKRMIAGLSVTRQQYKEKGK